MDVETFDEVTVPADLIGDRRWLLKEGNEFTIRFVEGKAAEVVFPPNFADEVVETAEPTVSGHASHVTKEAKSACGLTILVHHQRAIERRRTMPASTLPPSI